MAQVTVNINGKAYRMACDDGQEAHLAGLAERLNASIDQLRDRFGEIGDQRLTVMAAITFADQFSEVTERLKRLEAKVADLEAARMAAAKDHAAADTKTADAITAVAARIEGMAARISSVDRNEDEGA
jgi:cell division protein ZapA